MLQRILRPTLFRGLLAARPALVPLRPITTTPLLRNLLQPAVTPAVPPPLDSAPHESLMRLPALKAQPSHYITIHIHSVPFLVTVGDKVQLPFRMKEVTVGDTLRLTHASVLGSRDYTIKGTPYIDEKLFECRAVVIEETSEPMRIKKKTKRRQRRTKTVKSKHRFTVLRISELIIHDAPPAAASGESA
ncbi:hypothetical protein RUND412_003100 [Rhizina undulata]